jgi:hypothetical protein
LKKALPILNFAGKKSMYGAMEPSIVTTKIYQYSRRYSAPSVFLTMALDDKNNGNALRMTYRSVDNDTFPARVRAMEGDGNQIHGDLLKCLREESTLEGVGRIDLPCRPDDRAKAAMENSVAYMTEYKAILIDVLSILIGIPPSNISLGDEGLTMRKTKYFKHRKKGIFGTALAYYGVNEAHAKGNMHFHLVIWGGISSKVLHKYGGVPRICEAISTALNSMHKATLPADVLKERIVKDVVKELDTSDATQSVSWKSSTVPILLRDRDEELKKVTMEHGDSASNNAPNEDQHQHHYKVAYLPNLTDDAAATKQNHNHEATCRKGHNGKEGCRFCKPSDMCDCTKPVILEPAISVDETGDIIKETFKVIEDIPPPEFGSGCPDPIDKPDQTLVVWELERPSLKDALPMPGLDETEEQQSELELSKLEVKGNPELNKYLAGLSCDQLHRLYKEVAKRIERANGNVVEYNPILTYCTGSHNNAACLGSSEQGKAALFYLSSYFSKNKQALEQCLSILRAACHETKKFPSKAEDT